MNIPSKVNIPSMVMTEGCYLMFFFSNMVVKGFVCVVLLVIFSRVCTSKCFALTRRVGICGDGTVVN